MTANKKFKALIRARARKTGESYTAALRFFQTITKETEMNNPNSPTLESLLWSASRRARASGCDCVSVEHLLLELTETGSLNAAERLREVKSELESRVTSGGHINQQSEEIRVSAELQRVAQHVTFETQFSAQESELIGDRVIRAVLGDRSSPAAKLLRKHGIDSG